VRLSGQQLIIFVPGMLCVFFFPSIAMKGDVSKSGCVATQGLPAVIWVQQDALGLSCKNSN